MPRLGPSFERPARSRSPPGRLKAAGPSRGKERLPHLVGGYAELATESIEDGRIDAPGRRLCHRLHETLVDRNLGLALGVTRDLTGKRVRDWGVARARSSETTL